MLQSFPHCVACNGTEIAVFWKSKHRTICECGQCGLLFVFPQPAADDIHSDFQGKYFAAGESEQSTRLDLEFDLWRKRALSRIAETIKGQIKEGQLLDVGCASGAFLDFFCDGNWKLCGVEPSLLAFGRAQARFEKMPNVTLFNKYLTDTHLAPASFDVITVLESLFYMPDPRHELKEIGRLLKREGLLVIEIPSFHYQRFWRTGIPNYLIQREWCSLTTSHLYYFSDHSLATLLSPAGFRIVERMPMIGSVYGTDIRKSIQNLYYIASRMLWLATLGKLNMAPRTLYLCRR